MTERLSDQQAQLLTLTKAEVQSMLGRPVSTGHWTTTAPPEGATAAQLADWQAATLDEIWVYRNGRIHFTVDGKAAKVDDRTKYDLPPESMIV